MHSKGGNIQDDHLFLNQLFYQSQIQLHVLYQPTNSLKIHSVLAIISKVSTLVAIDSDKFKLSYFLYIIYINIHTHIYILPSSAVDKESTCQCANGGDPRDEVSMLALERSPGVENSTFWYSCLENSMDRGGWQFTVHGIAKSWTWLSVHAHTCIHTHIIYIITN